MKKNYWFLAIAIVSACLQAATYYTAARWLFSSTPERIMMWYPHWGATWLVLRVAVRPVAMVMLVFSTLALLWPFVKKAMAYIANKRTEVLLTLLSILLTLLLAEVVLRYEGYRLGQINYNSSFNEVEKLMTDENYLADSASVTYIHPRVAATLKAFIAKPASSQLGIYWQSYLQMQELESLTDFEPLAKNYAMVRAQLDNSPFTRLYINTLQKPVKDAFDSLIINYVLSPINSDGYRSIEFRKTSTRKRVLLIGDSFTYGLTTKNKVHSFYDHLLATGLEVYNTGINGLNPAVYEAVARKYVPLLKPDVVVVNFYMGNDVQYFSPVYAPFQSCYYWTNAGPLDACPGGVPLRSKEEAYMLAKESVSIPQADALNRVCSRTVLTTLLWDALKDVLHFNQTSPLLNEFFLKAKRKQLEYPDANNRLAEIQKLCNSNGSALILAIIPEQSLTDTSQRLYAHHDKKLFPHITYHEPLHLTATDFCTGNDSHFNEAGHRKYAAFLKNLIDSVLQQTP